MNGRWVHTLRFCFVTVFVLSLWQQISGQEKTDQLDDIPRQRLLTTTEFIQHLDTSSFNTSSVPSDILQNFFHHLATRRSPRYYFNPHELPERIRRFMASYPDTVKAMKRDADEFIGRFGADADWVGTGTDARGVKHNPNTLRMLARQRYAESIALQWHFRKEESYVKHWKEHVRDFAADVEAGKAEKGGNDIFERFYAGHRLRNWLAVHELLRGEKVYPRDDQLTVIKTLILNAANIVDQCKKFSYGNHQLVGAEALYEATLMFPEFAVLRRWNTQAKKIILEHFDKEITTGGFQLERSSHYHKLDIVNYLRFYRLATLNHDPLPDTFEKKLHSMFTAMAELAAPNKKLPLLQDVSDSVQARFDEIADEMSAGALLFRKEEFKFFGHDRFPAGYFWFFPLEHVEEYSRLSESAPTARSVRQEGSDYVVQRDGWDRLSQYLLIDAGLAVKKPDHTHGGILGLIVMSGGELFLPNYPVRYSDPAYPVLKNSYSKNVAIADSLPQARGWIGNAANTGFGKWKFLPTPQIRAWESTPEYDFFSASHNGFDTIGVSYSRSVFYRKGSYWIVVDEFSSTREHTYQQIWQGAYALQHGTVAVQTIGRSELVIQQINDGCTVRPATAAGYYPSLWFEKRNARKYRFITLLFPRRAGETVLPQCKTVDGDTEEIAITRGKIVDRIIVLPEKIEFRSRQIP